jgi:hypothetical protein
MQIRFLKGLLLGLVVLLAVPAIAQDTGIITGRVQDPTGAVVVGAQVSIIHVETNIDNPSRTNDEGMFRVPALRPGIYRVAITAAGFKKYMRESVDLRVGVTLPVNANLEVGATSDTVEVTAATPLLETETSSTGTVIEGDYLYRMPNFQRNAKGMLYLTPGVTVSGFGYAGFLGGFSINGESSGRIGYFEDGMYGVSPNNNGYTTDTIENTIDEIKILTTVLPAEYGHSAGGAITVVKKSGTNQLHGLVSEYGRAGGMQHRKFFDKYKLSQPRPELGLPKGDTILFQQPDANISGPIYIPKIYDGRNKSFFLFAVQRLIEKQGKQTLYGVPTAGELIGDFSYPERPANAPAINPIYDPRTTVKNADGTWSRQPFSNNIIPISDWQTYNPVAKKFMDMKPWMLPNQPGDWGTTGPSNNFLSSAQKRVFWENYSIRGDHQATSKLKLFVNWTYNSRFERTPNANIANSELDSSLNKNMNYQNTAGIGSTYVITPTLIAETRMNYYRYDGPTSSTAYGQDWGKRFGMPNVGKNSMFGGLPITVGNPNVNVQETFNFREDVSKMMGKHAFKMGYDLLRIRSNSHGTDNDAGSFGLMGTGGLNANGTSINNTGGDSLANFLIGAANSYSISINLLSSLPRDWIHSLYVQDDWKILPTLTANIGVRYLVESTPTNKYGQQSNFDPTAPDNTMIGAIGVITHPKGSMYNRDWNNFQPRIGLAWNARKNIVVRTGFALNTVDNRAGSPPTNEFGSISATWNQPSGEYRQLFRFADGPDWTKFAYPAVRADGSIPMSGSSYSGRGATWVNPDRPNAYSMNWNFNIQYGLSNNYLVEASYTGNRSLKGQESWGMNQKSYEWAWNLLQTNPTEFTKMEGNTQAYRTYTNFGGITYQGVGSNSIFHSGTIKIEKRYSHGLTMMAYYTLGKSISESTGSIYIPRSINRSPGGRKHQFNSSMNYELPIGKGRKFMNRGGVLNALFGGFDMVWVYQISSGERSSISFSSPGKDASGKDYKYMPGIVDVRSNSRFNSTGKALTGMRDNWQDIGGDRFVQSNMNRAVYDAGAFPWQDFFSIPASYTQGNMGSNTFTTQRFISASFSASKEVKIKERYTIQFRYDFQNPFKWYNLNGPNMGLNLNNINKTGDTFGKIGIGESSSAGGGGVPIQNITLAFRF